MSNAKPSTVWIRIDHEFVEFTEHSTVLHSCSLTLGVFY